MKRTRIRRLIAVFAVMLISITAAAFAPADVFADSGGYTTPEYDVNVVTDENHVFHFEEIITVDFNEYRHGIYRNIPVGGSLYAIKNVRVYGYEYESYYENSNLVIKIGSADYTVYGLQKYRITYDIVGYADGDTTKDRLAVDLLPTGWYTDIGKAKLSITFPKRIEDIQVFSGKYKEEGDGDYFLVSDDGKSLTAVSKETVPQGVGFTIAADLPEGYWVDPLNRADSLPVAYGILGALAALMLGLWAAVGRDKAVIKPVEFYPPNNMDPLQVSYIANDKVDPKDVAAMFMHFASKGYLKVIQEDKKKFKLQKLKHISKNERTHAKVIFGSLFSGSDTVSLKKLPSGFGETASRIEKDVKASFGEDMTVFTASSRLARAIGTLVCVALPLVAGLMCTYMGFGGLVIGALTTVIGLFIGLFSRKLVRQADAFHGRRKPIALSLDLVVVLALILAQGVIIFKYFPLLAIVFAACMLVALVSTIFVRQRANNDLYGRVLGFKEFIKTAEYDRLKLLSEQDPEYYFNIMPYAYVLGMSNKWADKFADFKIPQPAWFEGDAVPYDPFFPHRMFIYSGSGIDSSVSAYHREIGADLVGDITSGGGGGGSFSGGGFGGGGGGSW